jgi:trans-aconitate methyltransferase
LARRQSWDPDLYARNARFVADLATAVVDLLAPRAGERVLDLGCGDGVLTKTLVDAGCSVIGVDSSSAQVAAAVAAGIDARLGDVERLEFSGEFDAVFSNAALHWIKRPERPIDGAWRALKPGGRFVGELGGHGCVRTIECALVEELERRGVDAARVHPWYFPTDAEYRRLLEARGFSVSFIALIPRPTPLPGDILGWLETFAGTFCSALPESQRQSYLTAVRDRLRPALCDAGGRWTADYVRLRFAATRPVA